jgi:hypothetical protein
MDIIRSFNSYLILYMQYYSNLFFKNKMSRGSVASSIRLHGLWNKRRLGDYIVSTKYTHLVPPPIILSPSFYRYYFSWMSISSLSPRIWIESLRSIDIRIQQWICNTLSYWIINFGFLVQKLSSILSDHFMKSEFKSCKQISFLTQASKKLLVYLIMFLYGFATIHTLGFLHLTLWIAGYWPMSVCVFNFFIFFKYLSYLCWVKG